MEECTSGENWEFKKKGINMINKDEKEKKIARKNIIKQWIDIKTVT